MTPDSPEWSNYYLRLKEKLVGRPLPIVITGDAADDFPSPPAESMEAYLACKGLVNGADFATVMAFLRTRLEAEKVKIPATTATEPQLRVLKAREEFLEWIPKEIVGHIEHMDSASIKRQEWEEARKKQTPGQPANP